MNKKIYAITTGSYSDYHILGVTSSKKSIANIISRLVDSGYKEDEIYVEEFNDLFFLRDNTYKSYEVKFQTVSDGYKEFSGGTAEEVSFGKTLYTDYLVDSEGRPSLLYVFGHDRNEAVRHALKILESCPKTEPVEPAYTIGDKK